MINGRSSTPFKYIVPGTVKSMGVAAAGLCLWIACGNRSFWCDEAAVWSSLAHKTAWQIIFDGPLEVGQKFPKFYLALIRSIYHLSGPSTFWPRFLSLIFGLAAIFTWLRLFKNHYLDQRNLPIGCLIACGMLTANTYVYYYSFELKPYSADLFFSGLLSSIFMSESLSLRRRIILLVLTAHVAFLFSYAALFVCSAIVIAALFSPAWRMACWQFRKFMTISAASLTILLFILDRLDYRFNSSAGVYAYWQEGFSQGTSFALNFHSLMTLYSHHLFNWWRTEFGWINETVTGPVWYALPLRVFKSPDIRNIVFYLSFLVLARTCVCAIRQSNRNYSLANLAVAMMIVLAVLSRLSAYPWLVGRLTLFAMPFSIVLIVESFNILECAVKDFKVARGALWILLTWLVIRNTVFVYGFYLLSPIPEDLNYLKKFLASEISNEIVVAKDSYFIVKSWPGLPKTFKLRAESAEPGIDKINLESMKNHSFYYLWVHTKPSTPFLAEASKTFIVTQGAVPDSLSMGYYLLSRKQQKPAN